MREAYTCPRCDFRLEIGERHAHRLLDLFEHFEDQHGDDPSCLFCEMEDQFYGA